MAIYEVQQAGSTVARLVKARNKAQAIGYVSRDVFEAYALTAEEVATRMMNGVNQVEDAEAREKEGQQT